MPKTSTPKLIVPSPRAQHSTRPKNVNFQRDWYIIDASKKPLGRVASEAAKLIMGKNRADYSPDVDRGGVVVIINCDKPVLTGKKAQFKTYIWHTHGVGGMKSRTFAEQMAKNPTKAVYQAVKGMLPKNRLQSTRLNERLKLIVGSEVTYTQKLIEI